MPEVVDARGQCLCGAVTLHVTGHLRNVLFCHCHRCRRFTGHHMAATAARADDVTIVDTDGTLTWYAPVPEVAYGFCSRCGASLFWRAHDRPNSVSICAGVLDPPTHLHATSAWWISEASDYFERPALPERATE